MNVVLEKKPAVKKKTKIIYIILLIICLIAISVAVYMQFFRNENLGLILGITNNNKSEEEYEILKQEFDNLFNNTARDNNNVNINKIQNDREIIYTGYQSNENSPNNYDINVNIPYININSDIIKKYNQEIRSIFEEKAKSILTTKDEHIIYTVEYGCYLDDGILSLIIRSTLKEGNSAQRVIIQTYNYNLQTNQEITIEQLIKAKGTTNEIIQGKIDEEIYSQQQQAEELRKLGYNIYARDYKSDIYKIENIQQFFINNDDIYIIYPYGNDNFTSEMDLIIF